MSRTAEPATEQSEAYSATKPAKEVKGPKTSENSFGIHYVSKPKVIKKTREPEPKPKEDVDILIDFGMQDMEELSINKHVNLKDWLEEIKEDAGKKAPRYWFNALARKVGDYESTLLFILNLKVTLLGSKNPDFSKEWRLTSDFGVTPQDIQEAGSIATSVFGEKKIDENAKSIMDIVDDKNLDEKDKMLFQEIIANIAAGNSGGLYKESKSVRRRGKE